MRPNRKEPASVPFWFQSPKFGRMAASYRGSLMQVDVRAFP